MKKKRAGVTRGRAAELIEGLIERARAIDRDPQYVFRVSRMAVFGSYLTNKEKLGDIDIAVELAPKERNAAAHHQRCDEQINAESRHRDLIGRAFYPQSKVFRALRAGHKSFSFHAYYELPLLKTRSTVIYRKGRDAAVRRALIAETAAL